MLRKNLIPWMLTAGLLLPTAACDDDDSKDSSADSDDDDDDDDSGDDDDDDDSGDDDDDSGDDDDDDDSGDDDDDDDSGDDDDDDDSGDDDDSDSGDDGGQCVPTGSECESNGDCCGWDGGESSCVNYGGPVVCADNCWDGSDCASGCCLLLESGDGACAPSDACG